MYTPHPVFVEPKNKNVKIWRYMDFTKFVSLLDTQTIYFTRLDKFDDKFEGTVPKKTGIALDIFAKHHDISLDFSKLVRDSRKHFAVSCWHSSQHESAAMWKLYLNSNEGIAICSTLNRLQQSLIYDEPIYTGKVKYIDYDKAFFDLGNMMNPVIHKQKSFEHEKEIRAVIMKTPPLINIGDEQGVDLSAETIDNGIPVPVNISKLIQEIKVAPTAPSWFLNMVISVTKQYGHAMKVSQSNLAREPLY